MTNVRQISGIIAAVALIFLPAGCKKDETSAMFSLTGGKSFHFEYEQQKSVPFSARHIVKYHAPETPKGWGCERVLGRFIITAPSKSAISAGNADEKGTVTVSCDTDKGNTLKREITVAIMIADEITQRANCIIVSEAGKRFKFDATRRPGESEGALSTATSATLVWSTTKRGIKNVSLENGNLYFATAEETPLGTGNALVAVKDVGGKILWSWHLWVTDSDPREAFDEVAGVKVMNRNLGAFANSNATDDEISASYGLFYQWGRKDPFIGPSRWNASDPQRLWDGTEKNVTHKFVVSSRENGTVAYSVANPGCFITGAENNRYDWLYEGDATDRWSAEGSKSIYDPCPEGWRVAPPTIWKSFTTDGTATEDPTRFNVEGEYDRGWKFRNGSSTIYYPAAGRRSFGIKSKGNYTNIVNGKEGTVGLPVGFYWSSSYPSPMPETGNPPAPTGTLVFRADYINPAGTVDASPDPLPERAAASGFPLRCVKIDAGS